VIRKQAIKEFDIVFEVYNSATMDCLRVNGVIGSFDLNKFIENPDLVLTNGMAYNHSMDRDNKQIFFK
jgi:hypothetical protein